MAPHGGGTKFNENKTTKEKDQVKDQRNEDLKSRIKALNEELMPLLARVQELRERIAVLEDDRRDVLDKQNSRKEYR